MYRGGWCPYCNSELEALQKSLPAIHELGANLLAISPQLPEQNSEVAARLRLQFPILSDQGNAWSHANGMTFSLPAELREIYRDFGLDIPSFNGDDSWQLPIPARIVVDREGIIRSIEANPDYTQRPEPEVTLQVLRGLADKASKAL